MAKSRVAVWEQEQLDILVNHIVNEHKDVPVKELRTKLDKGEWTFKNKIKQLCKELLYIAEFSSKDEYVSFSEDTVRKLYGHLETEKYICFCGVGNMEVPIHVQAGSEEHAKALIEQDYSHLTFHGAKPYREYQATDTRVNSRGEIDLMILLVDGNNIAYRSFHTPQGNLTTKAGEPTGVILGTLNSLKGYLEKFPEVTRCIVVWDGGKARWRKEIYPEYKANRSYGDSQRGKEKFDGLFAQIDNLHQNLHKFNVNSIKVGGWEADDIIAMVCNAVEKFTKDHVMVVTSDKDMLQLVSDQVSIYTPYKDKVISPLNFYDETGVAQEAYIGYRALVGDPSDNIIGVPGIGEKTAKNLMDKWGHIDNILNAKGNDLKTLMKSKRTARIFEPSSLRALGINNKIMNFKYVPEDQEVLEEIQTALTSDMQVLSKEVKDYFKRWQFVNNLANYMTWIVPFLGLGDD